MKGILCSIVLLSGFILIGMSSTTMIALDRSLKARKAAERVEKTGSQGLLHQRLMRVGSIE